MSLYQKYIKKEDEIMSNYVITIARGYGSGGSHIAKQLSKDLGIKVYDTEILDMASEISGINESYFYKANEKIDRGFMTFSNRSVDRHQWLTYPANDERYFSNENLFAFQAKVIYRLASPQNESCIIIGKAANRILENYNNVLRLNIQASEDKCIDNICKRLCVDEKEAQKKIKKIDQYRTNYYKYYTGGYWLDPAEYDLSINTSVFQEDTAAKIIEDILKLKFPECFL